jgi:hypothetical protein
MTEPILKQIFGESWNKLPEVMKKHYVNRPSSNDVTILEGLMDVKFSKIFKILSPIFSFSKLLIPKEGTNIFTRVTLRSNLNSNHLNFERELFFPKDNSIKFFSCMIPIKQNEIMEIMNYRICWNFFYSFENNLILLKHKGYALRLFGIFIPLPISLLFGKGYAEEEAISEDEFRMKMTITHFLFGEIYRYQGKFKVTTYQI